MSAFYNENDPRAAAWLRELIAAGHIAPGIVDERSIADIKPYELTQFTQQHFFAGVGGWSLALRLAGWPDDKPVRTGSCPCQPFSVAGNGLCEADERHLWPNFRDLITFGEPTITFGEQVASKDGREWLAGVRADLEGLGYEVGAADLCAAGVGAPHPRQRLYWMAYANNSRPQGRRRQKLRECPSERAPWPRGDFGRMVLANGAGRDQGRQGTEAARHGRPTESAGGNGSGGLELSAGIGRGGARIQDGRESEAAGAGEARRLEHAESDGRQQRGTESDGRSLAGGCGWSDFDVLPFRDGKLRRVEAGTFPLAHGVPNRVGLLRGYGNAIVPQVAATFIQAALEALSPSPTGAMQTPCSLSLSRGYFNY